MHLHDPLSPTISCQRWRDRRTSFRPSGEAICPGEYGVELLAQPQAKAFVCAHHYSGTFPYAVASVGLFRADRVLGVRLVGVATFSVPIAMRAIERYANQDPACGIELGRFVLLDEVPANGESWFLARAFQVLERERPEKTVVLAYSDPVRRQSLDGSLILPGHVGTIYQASSAHYAGRGTPRSLWLDRDGHVISERAISKIRLQEAGAQREERMLVSRGASPRRHGEDPRTWVLRALHDGPFRPMRHPGNHVYVFALGGQQRRRRVRAGLPPSRPYPKITLAA